MNNKEAAKIKLMRKTILTSLNYMYPTGLQLATLYRTVLALDITYDEGLFQKDVTYLREKGYVDFVDELIGGAGAWREKVARLSPKGKEIADRTQTDPALEI